MCQRIWIGLVALLFVSACSDSGTNDLPIQTVTETGYLTCEEAPTCDGALCTNASGATECVPLPDTCEGSISCACLAETACGDAQCTDATDGGGIACGESADTCEPGASFQAEDGCNSCVCPANGVKSEAVCTQLDCASTDCTNKACGAACSTCDSASEACPTVEEYCNADGICSATPPQCPDTCEPGSSVPAGDGCNTCTCPESGLVSESVCTQTDCASVGCAGKACGASCSTCDPSAEACPDVEEYCNADGVCSAVSPQCPDTCEPGTSVPAEDGCNTCTCPESGILSESVCTQIDCASDDCLGKACGASCSTCDPSAEACPDVEEYCNADGVCSAVSPQCPDTCEPGTEFPADDGCNSCTCPDSGLKVEAICTQMPCAPGCNTSADCNVDGMAWSCWAPEEELPCGMISSGDDAVFCATDSECVSTPGQGPQICESVDNTDCLALQPGTLICKTGCASDAECKTGESCSDNRCVAWSCDEDISCPTNFWCDGTCKRKSCTSSADCEGECVKSLCYETKGSCGPTPP